MSDRHNLIKEIINRKANWSELYDFAPTLEGHTEKEKDQMIQAFLRDIRERYPMPTKHELLELWNSNHDWQDMQDRIGAYWTSVGELLKDAIVEKRLDIITYLAPLYVFCEDKAQFFPGGIIQEDILPLFGEANLKPLSYYKSLPYCIKSEDTYYYGHERGVKNLKVSLIAYSEEARQNCCTALIQHNMKRYDIEENELALEYLEDDQSMFAYYAEGLWLSTEKDRFVRLPYGLLSDKMEDFRKFRYRAAIDAYVMNGWDVHYDGVTTVFGEATYSYIISSSPEHNIGIGNIWRNGVIQSLNNTDKETDECTAEQVSCVDE